MIRDRRYRWLAGGRRQVVGVEVVTRMLHLITINTSFIVNHYLLLYNETGQFTTEETTVISPTWSGNVKFPYFWWKYYLQRTLHSHSCSPQWVKVSTRVIIVRLGLLLIGITNIIWGLVDCKYKLCTQWWQYVISADLWMKTKLLLFSSIFTQMFFKLLTALASRIWKSL